MLAHARALLTGGEAGSGSYLAVTHLASDLLDLETREGLEDFSGLSMRRRITPRGREEVARFSRALTW